MTTPTRRQIACYGNPEPFVIPPNRSLEKRQQQAAQAIAICHRCTLLHRCRQWVLAKPEDPCPAMVVAAMTPQQRQQTRNRQGTNQ